VATVGRYVERRRSGERLCTGRRRDTAAKLQTSPTDPTLHATARFTDRGGQQLCGSHRTRDGPQDPPGARSRATLPQRGDGWSGGPSLLGPPLCRPLRGVRSVCRLAQRFADLRGRLRMVCECATTPTSTRTPRAARTTRSGAGANQGASEGKSLARASAPRVTEVQSSAWHRTPATPCDAPSPSGHGGASRVPDGSVGSSAAAFQASGWLACRIRSVRRTDNSSTSSGISSACAVNLTGTHLSPPIGTSNRNRANLT
jgi:hypothetical protein